MALEDFSCFRAVPGAVCFYPFDAVSCERAMELAANHRGVTFIRTSRPTTPVIYKPDEVFKIGEGKVWGRQRSCGQDGLWCHGDLVVTVLSIGCPLQ